LRIGQIQVINRVFTVLLFLLMTPLSQASDWLSQLQLAVETELGNKVEKMAEQMLLKEYESNIKISYLDPRLNLPVCSKPLSVTPPSPLNLGRNHIKVYCKEGKSWALNVPVEIQLITQVVVLNQPISKGIVLKASQLDYQNQNLSQLRNGYYLKKSDVIGKQSKRALQGLTVVNSHLVLPALMVHKGDRVMITASKGAMVVKMPGEALNDGREGRQIRVRNKRSQRIIKATVVAQGLVEVYF